MIAVSYGRQLLPGTFEHALSYLIDNEMDLGRFGARFKNDETGAPAYDPAVLLKVVLFAYSRGITSSRTIARACVENVVRAIIGIGAITADAAAATVGNAREFKQGRQMSAWLGLVPTQHSSGGHARLGEISCRGDAYLRTLLIQGARSSLQRAKAVATEKATPEQLWIRTLDGRMPFGKVLVAIANKHARQIWVMLAHDVDYDPHACLNHPMHRQTEAAQAA